MLSKGQAGRVYAAIDPSGRRVALKELLFATLPGADELTAFEREVELLKQLRHPRIPRFIDAFRDGDGAELRLYRPPSWSTGSPWES